MMLAGWPPGVRHSLRNGCETPGEVPPSPVEKRGSDEAGSAALAVAPFVSSIAELATM